MAARNWTAVPFLALVVAVPARAADAAPATPTVVVQLKSIEGILADARYLAALGGQEEAFKQVDKTLPQWAGPKGFAGSGIDMKRPIGLYGVLDAVLPNSQAVLLIPVTNEKDFVAFLNHLAGMVPNVKAEITKGDDGIYTVGVGAPIEGYFTIADGYAYITAYRRESLTAANRLSPAKLLPADDRTLLRVSFRIDQIDPSLKQIALGQLENQMAAAKDKKSPNETPAQTKLKTEVIDHTAKQIRSLLTDGRALEFKVVVDRKTDDFSAQLTLSGTPGSPLAQEIANMASKSSRFGQLAGAAAQVALNVAIPSALRDAFGAAVDDSFKQEQAKQKDENKKAMAQKVFDAIAPTIRAAQLDAFGGIAGPSSTGKYTFFAGLKLQDAAGIERVVKELVPQIPDEKAKKAITLDAETVGGINVHKVVPYDFDDEARRLFGDSATGVFAFPADAVVGAFGADAPAILKQVLGATGRTGGPLAAEAAVSRLATMDKNTGPAARKAADEVFGSETREDVVRLTVEGGPALKVRATLKGKLITFGVKLDESSKAGKR